MKIINYSGCAYDLADQYEFSLHTIEGFNYLCPDNLIISSISLMIHHSIFVEFCILELL